MMTCPAVDMYQIRHNVLLPAMLRLVRSAGATARPELAATGDQGPQS